MVFGGRCGDFFVVYVDQVVIGFDVLQFSWVDVWMVFGIVDDFVLDYGQQDVDYVYDGEDMVLAVGVYDLGYQWCEDYGGEILC